MKSLDTIVNTLMGSLPEQKKTEAYDTPAEVRRVEDEIAWVHIPGGVDETPVKMTINAKPGETVQVRVSNGQAFMVGNASAPPTDDSTAIKALNAANTAATAAASAVKSAGAAAEAAADAQETADSVRGIAEQAMADATAASSAASQAQADATAAGAAAAQAQADATAAGTAAAAASSAAATADQKATAAGSAASSAQTSADSAASAASAAQTSANAAGEAASRAQAAADAAQGDIDDQQEYFWHDSLGAHVLSDTDEITGKRYRTDLKGSGQEIFELDGATATSVARFGADGVRIGQEGGYYVETTEDGVGIYDPSQRVLQIAANSQSPDFPKAILLGEGIVSVSVWNNGSGADVHNQYDFMGADGLSDSFGRYVRDGEVYTKAQTNNLLSSKADTSSLSPVATSGDYDDLNNKPTIPTATSDLANDSGFLNKLGILNLFYPVGSYYETSDAGFDPNTAWGGTWELEAEGLVHISAGQNYIAGDNHGAETVTLATGNIPQFKGTVNLASNLARNNITNPPIVEAASGVLARAQRTGRNAVKVSSTTVAGSQTIYDTINLTLGSASPIGVSVMQPDVAVNRWHRTA